MGVPYEDESLAGETLDEGKLQKTCGQLGETPNAEFYKRFGQNGAGGRKRPIFVTLSQAACDEALIKSKKLKEAGVPYEWIFVKKKKKMCTRM